jgi:cyanate lyase
MHKQGLSWAEIGEQVGQRSRAITVDIYSHTIADYREIDRVAAGRPIETKRPIVKR